LAVKGRFDPDIEPFNPVKVVTSLVEISNAQMAMSRNKHVKTKLRLQKNLPYIINGDSKRIQQILHGLINTLIKYFPYKEKPELPKIIDLQCSI